MIRATLAKCSPRFSLWSTADYDQGAPPLADLDVDNSFTVNKIDQSKLITTVPGQSAHNGAWHDSKNILKVPIINHNQAQINEQTRINHTVASHYQLFDSPMEKGVAGVWSFPYFLSDAEQKGVQEDLAARFRDPRYSIRVKNTCTLMKNSRFVDGTGADGRIRSKSLRHGWIERNHPAISHIGRRNLVHVSTDDCEARKKSFLNFEDIPSIASINDKIWQSFSTPRPATNAWSGSSPQEWFPVLDRKPNLVRCSEWLEHTSGMNHHIKAPSFGNYICIINLHTYGLLQLCHPDTQFRKRETEYYDTRTNLEIPDGHLPATKLVLLPGSLTILKYDARWSIPYGYSYEQDQIFRGSTFPKDYRVSLMFSHFSKSNPGTNHDEPIHEYDSSPPVTREQKIS
eukprot:TRINITY_DN11815_c0_g1_i2.p1 TRINITY_DN11815_c0_g1~~TRINITY_DN11815_c0_g1_i2.p1  ORF type:complete len:400 (+),score=32.98 TRINITY_DN11815_c0_g1_i2:40-1239(+)